MGHIPYLRQWAYIRGGGAYKRSNNKIKNCMCLQAGYLYTGGRGALIYQVLRYFVLYFSSYCKLFFRAQVSDNLIAIAITESNRISYGFICSIRHRTLQFLTCQIKSLYEFPLSSLKLFVKSFEKEETENTYQ